VYDYTSVNIPVYTMVSVPLVLICQAATVVRAGGKERVNAENWIT